MRWRSAFDQQQRENLGTEQSEGGSRDFGVRARVYIHTALNWRKEFNKISRIDVERTQVYMTVESEDLKEVVNKMPRQLRSHHTDRELS